nr:hypothetical protein [Pseudopontixanthobacter vadosimaris]
MKHLEDVMKLSKFAAATAALSLATAPVMASAADMDRAAAPVVAENNVAGNSTAGLIGLFALVALALFIFIDEDDVFIDEDDVPVSA